MIMRRLPFLSILLVGAVQADTTPAHDQHWAVQPVKVPAVPVIDGGVNPVDAFVLARLKEKGLRAQLSPEATPRELIRRLSSDLTGLPPTPEEVAVFEKEMQAAADGAYDRLVERLLASRHYGERWAQHWLDIAHYADTHGFERDKLRPNAWRYRDYVINAFNSDKPYDQFLREQIAGDVLEPDNAEAVTATGFLAAGPWDFVGHVETASEMLRRAARAGDLDDMVTQVMTSTVALTVNCARCHDHKLDPISQKEYYQLWSVFSGVQRGDRDLSAAETKRHASTRAKLEQQLQKVRLEQSRLTGGGLSLADLVGGGDGLGSAKKGGGIDPRTGQPQDKPAGYLSGVTVNRFTAGPRKGIDGVVIPGGGDVPVSSTGLLAKGVRKTSGQAWDAIRNGPVNSQFSTKHGGTDFARDGHTLLGLHANAAITFDLAALPLAEPGVEHRFTATAGYFGAEGSSKADFAVYVDGEKKEGRERIGRKDGVFSISLMLPAAARFLTLMATDGGDGLGNDQICFADARLESLKTQTRNAPDEERLATLRADEKRLLADQAKLTAPAQLYGVQSGKPEVVKVLKRGDPESPQEEVTPGSLGWVQSLPARLASGDAGEGERRVALAMWITDPRNPLTARVMVNRLWHHHFGQGLVLTPSDFGHGGDRPSHPELLDWLANELTTHGWSLKHVHRLMVTSAAYRQSSMPAAGPGLDALKKADAGNRLLWRQNPRRLDAESLRDAVLMVSGKLNLEAGGPGYRDFNYTEAYAPIYDYVTPDRPDLWRRSVYRFVVRTTPHQFMTTLDCPNPANLNPARILTTTALQALTLSNNAFMLQQAGYLAERVARDAGTDAVAQTGRAFELCFGRTASDEERAGAAALVKEQGLAALCRMLLNANEFVYVD